jgi:hypothetical protein
LPNWAARRRAGSPADLAKLVADETEKWGKVIRGGQHQTDMIPPTTLMFGTANNAPYVAYGSKPERLEVSNVVRIALEKRTPERPK